MSGFAMIFLVRIFWGVFLGAVLAGASRAAWNMEHGKRGTLSETRKDTMIWIDPLMFPIVVILYLFLAMALAHRREMLLASLLTDMFASEHAI